MVDRPIKLVQIANVQSKVFEPQPVNRLYQANMTAIMK